MSTLLEGVSLSGVVKEGECYLLFEGSCGELEDEIDSVYLVRSEYELRKSLEAEMEIVLAEMFLVKKFVGITQVEEGRHQIEFLCRDNWDGKKTRYFLYLHRLKSCHEKLVEIKELFEEKALDM